MDRPSFHESWFRVADLRPRLRTGVEVRRQVHRGRPWFVLGDPATERYYRLSEPAWRFVGLLDGKRSCEEALQLCLGQLGDEAPTQGEALRVLGQLYNWNLLASEAVGDAETALRRRRERRGREVRSRVASLLFVRIPLFDPDRLLERWAPMVAWMFTPLGFVLWLCVVAVGVWQVAGRSGELVLASRGVLAPSNLIALYAAFAVIKLAHELGHGFACKVFGRRQGGGGAVHTLGVMLLVFIPMPYVDASSAWALRSKRQRIIVGAAGMMAELIIAAVAAIVWVRTDESSASAVLAYNVMFIAGVSTLLFNLNPLLKYDGYYILCDWLETPNLAQRARDYVLFLIRRYAWGMPRARGGHVSGSERWLLPLYAVSAFAYRVVLFAVISVFVAAALPVIGVAIAALTIGTLVLTPAYRSAAYVLTSGEIQRVRGRAILTTVSMFAALVVLVGLIPVPQRVRIEGVARPMELTPIHAQEDGFVRKVARDGERLVAGESVIIAAEHDVAHADLERLRARADGYAARRRLAMTRDPAEVAIAEDQIRAVTEQLARAVERVNGLTIRPSHNGVFISPDSQGLVDSFVGRGEFLGVVAGLGGTEVLGAAGQRIAARLADQNIQRIELRTATALKEVHQAEGLTVVSVGQEAISSPALDALGRGGSARGGRELNKESPAGFDFLVRITPPADLTLRPGERVWARIDLMPAPFASQVVRWVRQTLQARFRG